MPTLTTCRHDVDEQISCRHTTGVLQPRDRSTWEIALIVVVMTPTNRQRAAPDIHIAGDGDTRSYTAKRTTLNKRPARDGVDLVLLDGNR
jgi:hypothetical protein